MEIFCRANNDITQGQTHSTERHHSRQSNPHSKTHQTRIPHGEPVLLPPLSKRLFHDYEEPLDATLLCYALEEIIAEKLRALLQTHRNLIERGLNPWQPASTLNPLFKISAD